MANDFTGNPWRVDAGPLPVTVTTDRARIKSVRWVGPTTAGHRVEIKDTEGRTMWENISDTNQDFAAAELIETSGPDDWNGVKVTTLDSGKLFITYY